MSKETWKAEFYPVPASTVPKDQAAAHSLQKWKGYTHENLGKYDLTEPPIEFNNYSCALCFHNQEHCGGCTLLEVRGGIQCDERTHNETRSPWHRRLEDRGRAMVYWLEKAATLEKQRREGEVTANSVLPTLLKEDPQ